MTKSILILMIMVSQVAIPQSAKQGKWLDTTGDTKNAQFFSFTGGKLLFTEDYEVKATHEICASVTGFFLEKSQLGRYDVRFKGMRTSAEFEFTTQYDAEKWVEKFCTPESLTSIGRGHANMGRSY